VSGEVGLYQEGSSIVHRLDPRVKLAWFILALVASVIWQYDGSVSVFIFISLIAGLAFARLSITRLILVITYSIVFFIVTILVWASYYQDTGRVLYYIGFINLRLTDVGLLVGLGKFFLIVNPIVAIMIFFSTTRPYEMIQSLERLRLPYKAGFILFLSLRLLPLTLREIRNIVDVQKARGIEVDSPNPIKRVAYTIPIFVPLIIRIMSLTWETSITLMVRGFGHAGRRTYTKPLRWSRRDTIALIVLIIIYTGISILRIYGFSTYYSILGAR
jgi:energy-coupling factor transport system permease protein